MNHVCRGCRRLGPEELALRQLERNLDRALDWRGLIRRGQRGFVERHVTHEHPRIREYAARLLADDRALRDEWRREREVEEAMLEASHEERRREVESEPTAALDREQWPLWQPDELPF
jgi:hypothetical protein